MRTTATIGDRVHSGDQCFSCGTGYSNCTTLVLTNLAACCGTCASRSTHNERIEREAAMKAADIKIGQRLRVTYTSTAGRGPLIRMTSVYEGTVSSVTGAGFTFKGSTMALPLNGDSVEVELLEDAPLDPGYYVVTNGHHGDPIVRYWDGSEWFGSKGGRPVGMSRGQGYVIESALLEVPL